MRAPATFGVLDGVSESLEAPLMMAVRTLDDILIRFVHLLVRHLLLSAGAARDMVFSRKALIDKTRRQLKVPLMVPDAAAMDDLVDHRI